MKIQRINLAMNRLVFAQDQPKPAASTTFTNPRGMLSGSLLALGLLGLVGCKFNQPAPPVAPPSTPPVVEQDPSYTTCFAAVVPMKETFNDETFWSIRAGDTAPKWIQGRKYRLVGSSPELTQAINQKIEQWVKDNGQTTTIRVYGNPSVGNALVDHLPLIIQELEHVRLEK